MTMHLRPLLLVSLLAVAACDRAPAAPAEPAPPAAGSAEAEPSGEGSEEAAAPAPDDPAARVASIRITPDAVRVAMGDPLVELSAAVYDAAGNVLDVPVTWHSLDPGKVRVSERGVLTPLGPLGPAFITASAGSVVAEQVPVYVSAPAPPPPTPVEPVEEEPRVRRIVTQPLDDKPR